MAASIGARKAGEAMNVVRWDAPADGRSIQVVIDRLLDGFAVEVSITEGKETRVLGQATVASFLEAEKAAHSYAAKHRIPSSKVAMIFREDAFVWPSRK